MAEVAADPTNQLALEANHAETKLLICELAGIDLELAHEIERSFGDIATYPTSMRPLNGV